MKKKFKSKLILILAALVSLLLLGGCKIGESLEEVLDNRNLTAQVTYYSNGGMFDGDPDTVVKEMYYTDGSEILNVGVTGTVNGTATLERSNHDFGGWYYAEMNGDEPAFEDTDKLRPKLSDTKVEFPLTIAQGEHWYVAAKWIPHVKVQVKLAFFTVNNELDADNPDNVFEVDGTQYTHGADLEPFTYTDGKVQKPTKEGYAPFAANKVQDYTFVDYYYIDSENKQQPLIKNWPLQQAEGQTEDAVIYAKYIPGTWEIVREGSDVYSADGKGMFGSDNTGKRYWVANDIDAQTLDPNDFTNSTMIPRKIQPMDAFDAEIWGNGFTISYLSIDYRLGSEPKSLFGSIAATAKIQNLTLDNLTFTYTAPNTEARTVYFAFTQMAAGAIIQNVKLEGSLVKKGLGEVNLTVRLYGNKEGITQDEQYLEATYENENSFEFKVEADVA